MFLSSILTEMRISPRYLGYIYLQAIVHLVAENRLYLKSLSRFVYPQIAKEFGTAPKSVEKAVDNALNRAFEKGGLKELSTEACPPNKEVISYLVNRLNENNYKIDSSQVAVLRYTNL